MFFYRLWPFTLSRRILLSCSTLLSYVVLGSIPSLARVCRGSTVTSSPFISFVLWIPIISFFLSRNPSWLSNPTLAWYQLGGFRTPVSASYSTIVGGCCHSHGQSTFQVVKSIDLPYTKIERECKVILHALVLKQATNENHLVLIRLRTTIHVVGEIRSDMAVPFSCKALDVLSHLDDQQTYRR